MTVRPSRKPKRIRPARGVGIWSMAILCALLPIPIFALSRLTEWIDWRVLWGGPMAASLFTFFLYRSDKVRAEAGAWRIPEATLHVCELGGGWPGAFLAQRLFRHKVSKASYQVAFWFIVLVHQFVAIEFLTGWTLTQRAFRFLPSS